MLYSHMSDCMFIGETYGHKRLQCLQVMFLFTDAHVANESFLELINNMLTSGMIPALYDDGEKESLISGIREEVIRCHASCVLSNCDLRSICKRIQYLQACMHCVLLQNGSMKQ
jgi:hypothetical protein